MIMNRFIIYVRSIRRAFASLLTGMKRTLHSMLHPELILTQQYPENRETLYIPAAFKAVLVFEKDENGVPKCTACGLCRMNCPNGSISLASRPVQKDDGRTVKQIESYSYNLGSCTFCGLCVDACRFNAIVFSNKFEQSQYVKGKLNLVLYENSALTSKTEKE